MYVSGSRLFSTCSEDFVELSFTLLADGGRNVRDRFELDGGDDGFEDRQILVFVLRNRVGEC